MLNLTPYFPNLNRGMIKDLTTMNKTAPTLISPDQKTIPLWQQEMAQAIRSVDELYNRLELTDLISKYDKTSSNNSNNPLEVTQAVQQFPVLVPESFLKRMIPGDVNDPLLRQVLPVSQELETVPGFSSDPVGDIQAVLAPGMLQKYHGRALMVTVGHCAINCRYCFRRSYPYQQSPKSFEQWETSILKIKENPEIEEIILSGGDPLVLNDHKLGQLIRELERIDHLQRIRIHTRLPIVLPSRVTDQLLDMLTSSRLQPFFVVHSNHPNEIVDDCATALKRIVRAGIPVLNQSVLLRQINDETEIQEKLCNRLINLGVIPYYLHQLDRAEGTAHFETEVEVGLKIIEELKSKLPGYAVPRYVREIPGESEKTELVNRVEGRHSVSVLN